MQCPFCKEQLFDGASQCSNCGKEIPDIERPGERKPEVSGASTTPNKTVSSSKPSSKPSDKKQSQAETSTGGVKKIAVWIGGVLAVLVILVVIIAIAIPQFLQYRERSGCETAKADIKLAYTVAQAYDGRHPNTIISDIRQLEEVGFKPSKNVIIRIINGGSYTLIMSAKHSSCKKTYYVNYVGEVSDTAPDAVTVPVPAPIPEPAPAATSGIAPVPGTK
jgi:type II secretory pathway pseudopilin PulG